MKFEDGFKWINHEENITSKNKHVAIFVHGIFGSEKTWLNNNKQPNELINFIFSDERFDRSFDRALFSYYSSFMAAPKLIRLWNYLFGRDTRSINSIETVAHALHDEIEQRCFEYHSVTIIAHSMGGLIARKTILEFIENPTEHYNIKLLITLATPHQGSFLANIGSLLFGNLQIKDLKVSSKLINDLTSKWLNYTDKLPKCCYCAGLSDDVVSEFSGIGFTKNGEEVVRIDKNHSTILHPQSSSDLIVITIQNKLRDLLDERAKEISTLPEGIYSSLKNGDLTRFANNLKNQIILLNYNESVIASAIQFASKIDTLSAVNPNYANQSRELSLNILEYLETGKFIRSNIYESLIWFLNKKIDHL